MQDIFSFIQSHWLLSAAVVAVLILLTLIEVIRTQRGAKRISPQQTTQLINREQAIVIDIRSHEAYAKGHIIEAVSIPLADLENKQKKLDKYKSQPIILVCANGLDSVKAATILNKYGINAYILAGGIRSWQDADLPLVQ
jgi:rhodanese-related sulfurtransferase